MKKQISRQKLSEMALAISITKNELLTLGLIKTYHAIDEATRAIGYEMAEIIEDKHLLVEIGTMSENEDKDESREKPL